MVRVDWTAPYLWVVVEQPKSKKTCSFKFGFTLLLFEKNNGNLHGSVGIFLSSSISMSEMSERCVICAAKNGGNDVRHHQNFSRIELGASTYKSV